MKSGSDISAKKAEARNRKLQDIRARRRMRVITIVLPVVLLALVFKAVYDSHLFDIAEIKISGTKRLAKEQALKMSGVSKGQNLLKVSSSDIDERLRKNPWVKSVAISKRPLKSLEIEITERAPFALAAAKNGLFYVDEEGVAIDKVVDVTNTVLPRITDISVKVEPGKQITVEPFKNAMACLKSLDSDIKARIATLASGSSERLFLYTRDNIEILYGVAEETDKKNQVIKAILAQKKGKPIFMDVRTVSNPIVKRLDAEVEQ